MSPIIRFDPKPSPWDDHSEDIFQHALDNIAKDVQFHLRSRLDTGMDPGQANAARTVTVRNEMGQLVIQQGKSQVAGDNQNLFTPSTHPPQLVDGKMIFRQVDEESVTRRRNQAIKGSIRDAMTLKFKEYLEGGSKKIRSEKMGSK